MISKRFETESVTLSRKQNFAQVLGSFRGNDICQQRLKTVHPVYSAGTVWPWFLGIGIVLMAIAIPVIIETHQTKELEIDYTDCVSVNDPNVACQNTVDQFYATFFHPIDGSVNQVKT